MKVACIPVYNEERNVSKVVNECKKYVDMVVVCDDGSSDNTYKKAQLSGAKTIRHEQNLGKGAALKSLFSYVKNIDADVIVTLDGDGQFLPNEIPKLMNPILEKNYDVVIGYRFDTPLEMPSYRKIGNKVLDKVTNIASELPFRDTQSGFRAYSKKAIQSINFSSNGFAADSEILIDAAKNSLKIGEEKITVIYNTGGKTSTKTPISHAFEVFSSLFEMIAIRRPLALIGTPGIILIIIGIIFSVYVMILFNETRYFSIPFTLIALGSSIIGLLLLMMSVILYAINKSSLNKRE